MEKKVLILRSSKRGTNKEEKQAFLKRVTTIAENFKKCQVLLMLMWRNR